MRLSRYFLPVLKENPAEAQIVSHRYMLRAGMIKQQSAGIYSWLPLGLRVLRRVEQIVHEEQARAGHIPVLMALSAVAVVPFSVDVVVLVVALLSVVAVVALSSALVVADLDNSNTTTVAMHSVEAVVAVEEAGRTGTSRNALVRLRSSLAIPGSCSRRLTSTV